MSEKLQIWVHSGEIKMTHIDLSCRPGVQVDRSDETNVYSEVSVDAGTIYAHEDTECDGSPSRPCRRK